MLNVTQDPKHPVVAWSAPRAAMTINIARKGPDGRSAWRRRCGHEFIRPIAEFGEQVLHSQRRNVIADCLRGLFRVCFLVGCCNQTTYWLVLKMELLWVQGSFRRLSEAERKDPELLFEGGWSSLGAQWWRGRSKCRRETGASGAS